MNRYLVAAVAAVAVAVVGCGTSPKEACASNAKASCEKMWTCPNASVKVGENQADCENDFEALCVAAVETSPNKDGCPEGQKYDSAKAQECTSQIESQTCDQYAAGQPAACNEVCQ